MISRWRLHVPLRLKIHHQRRRHLLSQLQTVLLPLRRTLLRTCPTWEVAPPLVLANGEQRRAMPQHKALSKRTLELALALTWKTSPPLVLWNPAITSVLRLSETTATLSLRPTLPLTWNKCLAAVLQPPRRAMLHLEASPLETKAVFQAPTWVNCKFNCP